MIERTQRTFNDLSQSSFSKSCGIWFSVSSTLVNKGLIFPFLISESSERKCESSRAPPSRLQANRKMHRKLFLRRKRMGEGRGGQTDLGFETLSNSAVKFSELQHYGRWGGGAAETETERQRWGRGVCIYWGVILFRSASFISVFIPLQGCSILSESMTLEDFCFLSEHPGQYSESTLKKCCRIVNLCSFPPITTSFITVLVSKE